MTLRGETGDYPIRFPNPASTGKLVTFALTSAALSRGMDGLS